MTTHDSDIGILNTLISATADSAEAYRAAAERLDDQALRTAFQRRAAERKIIAANLEEQVESLGASPESGTLARGATHAVFNDLPGAAQTGGIDLINEVRRGEDRIRKLYQQALDDTALSALSLTAVRNALHSVTVGTDETGKVEPGLRQGPGQA
jgi:uncharacterized protein (TIGR02284 family)